MAFKLEKKTDISQNSPSLLPFLLRWDSNGPDLLKYAIQMNG